MEELNLNEVLEIIWKRKIEIVIILLVCIIIGSIYTLYFVSPKYSSTITLVLVSSNNDTETNSTITANDITLNSKLISTYSKLIESEMVLKEVISNLGLDMTIKQLEKSVFVNSKNNVELIEIKVEDANNEKAAIIANEVANVFKAKVRETYNINNIEILGEASIEQEPSNINHKKDIGLSVVAGMILGLAYAMCANMLDTTIKGPETIEEEFNLPVLTSIPIYEPQNNKNGGTK